MLFHSLGSPFLNRVVLVGSSAKKLLYISNRMILVKGYKNYFFLKLVQNIWSCMFEFLIYVERSLMNLILVIPNPPEKTFSVLNG